MSQQRRSRAGIIPYSIDDQGNSVILLGKEIFGKWSPFAGGVEEGENIAEAATREFVEEIMGFFLEDEIQPLLDDNKLLVIRGREDVSYYYPARFYYDPILPVYFENITKFFLRCTGGRQNRWGVPEIGTCTEGLFEKSEIAWFRVSELRAMDRRRSEQLFNFKAREALRELLKANYL